MKLEINHKNHKPIKWANLNLNRNSRLQFKRKSFGHQTTKMTQIICVRLLTNPPTVEGLFIIQVYAKKLRSPPNRTRDGYLRGLSAC